jgi:hypothetical protein
MIPPEGGIREDRDGKIVGGMKVRVSCYEGYRGEESPRSFYLGDRPLEVVEILDRWRGEDHEYFKLAASDGNRYILRRDREREEWEIIQFTLGAPGRPE